MRISDWSSDVCSSDLDRARGRRNPVGRGSTATGGSKPQRPHRSAGRSGDGRNRQPDALWRGQQKRSGRSGSGAGDRPARRRCAAGGGRCPHPPCGNRQHHTTRHPSRCFLRTLRPHPPRTSNDRFVRRGDLATVGTGSLTRYGAVSKNGQAEAVQGLVIALRGADARQVVDGVRTRLAEIESTLPTGTHVDVFYDRSDLIARAVGTVEKALLEAAVLVVVLLILFLGDWRAAAIVAATLPLAALITFLFMQGMGLSANLMSLGGLAIAIGLLVDGSIVVVENIVERLGRAHEEGTPRLNLVYQAASEVIVPVSAGIAIIALVFLPLLSLQGLEGKLFAPVALTIVFALAGSLLLALTLVPVLASFGLKSGHHGEPWLMRQLGPRYRGLLDGAFARKRLVYGLSAAGLVIAGIAYGAVGKTFMPTMDEGSIIVQLTKLPSIDLDQSVQGDMAAQRALMRVPEVQDVIARVGSDEIGLDPMSPTDRKSTRMNSSP